MDATLKVPPIQHCCRPSTLFHGYGPPSRTVGPAALQKLHRKPSGVCDKELNMVNLPPNSKNQITSTIRGLCWTKSNPWRPQCWLDLALTHWGIETGPLGVSCGVWHQGVGGRYLLQGGPVRIRLVPSCSMEAQSEWDLGNFEARLMPWALYHVPWAIPEQILCYGRELCPARADTATWECHYHEGMFFLAVYGWLIHVK